MYRDFSESSKNKLLELVSEVENDKISNFTDWVGDRWYDFESWIGKLNIKNYINSVNDYHKKVIDKNNTSQKMIEKIFKNVESVDNSYQKQLSSVKSSLQKWDKYIVQMSEIVTIGKFTAEYITDSLDGILKQYSLDEVNSRLSMYVEFDKTTGNYIYHWNEIEELFSKDTSEVTEIDYQLLVVTLSTMVDGDGNIDTDNLEKFINAGYTKPSQITATDFHESFEILPNGQKMSYYYIQNKSYMTDTLKMVSLLYKDACGEASVSGRGNNLNDLMQTLFENYSEIEWRRKLDYSNTIVYTNMDFDGWSGKLTISEDVLNSFNEYCRANITVDFVNNTDGSGLDYYAIKSNASNIGDVRTATVDGQFLHRNDSETDNYSDCTIRLYVDCTNANSDVVATVLKGKSIIAEYYQEFNIEEVLSDEAIKMIAQNAPVGGKLISALYDFASQTDTIGVITSGADGIKSADLNVLTNISKTTEKKVDTGIGEVNRAIGIYTKYKAVEENNKKVKENQEDLDDFSSLLMKQKNLGLEYNTLVVKYDHCSYEDGGSGIKVDSNKDCDKTTSCDILPTNYQFNVELLRKQYNAIMHTTISDSDFAELEKQVKEYIQTGNKADDSILAQYIEEWAGE